MKSVEISNGKPQHSHSMQTRKQKQAKVLSEKIHVSKNSNCDNSNQNDQKQPTRQTYVPTGNYQNSRKLRNSQQNQATEKMRQKIKERGIPTGNSKTQKVPNGNSKTQNDLTGNSKTQNVPTGNSETQNSSKDGSYTFFYTNLDCWTAVKHKELLLTIDMYNPDGLLIVEMQAKNPRNKIEESEVQIDGYTLFHNLNTESSIRGVCIYVKDSLNPNISSIQPTFKESIWVEIKENINKNLLLGCVYRSPNSTDENTKQLNTFISGLADIKNTELILVGDFNYPHIKWDAEGTATTTEKRSIEFIEQTRNAYLVQHISEPTRYRENQKKNTLDLLFTTREEIIHEINHLPPKGRSDHSSLLFTVIGEKKMNSETKKIYNYKNANYEAMKEDLGKINWTKRINEDVENSWILLKATIHDVMEKYIPKATIYPNKRKRPLWMNQSSLSKVRKKHAAWKRYLETKSGEDYLKYTRARNQARRETRKAQKNFESKLAKEIKHNSKSFWKYVHSKTKLKSKIPDLYIPGSNKKTSSDKEKAEVLNNFFKEVFTVENTDDIPYLESRKVDQELKELFISTEDVKKVLKDINPNKATGPDGIPARILKELCEVLAEPLALLFSCSLKKGQIPTEWKLAHITPIFKKGQKTKAENYRPVSLTAIICRKMESFIVKAITNYLFRNNLISENQHGFLMGRSTVTQLLETLAIWTAELDKGNNMNVLYCDFKKAFDTVPHKRLLEKIKSYGIKGNVLNWITDFLAERKQRVCVNGKLSEWKNVTSGVTQGSVLGPLLFVIYINDLEDSVNCGVKLYADDTKIFAVVNSDLESENFQKQIDSLTRWSETWKLHFHPDKCHVLKIGNKPDATEYNMQNNSALCKLEESTEEKDLGVIIDNKLTFRKHCEKIATTANKLLGILRRNFTYIDDTNFNHLYKGLIRPIIEYAAQVYNPMYQREIVLLENIQRRATKMVIGLHNKSYEERLTALKLPTLIYRRARGDMIQVYKYIHNMNKCSEGLLNLAGDGGTRGHSLKLKKTKVKLNLRNHFFTERVVDLWNALQESTVWAPNLNIFKNKLDKEWEDKPWKFNMNTTFS